MNDDQRPMNLPRVVSRDRAPLSRWVTLETIAVAHDGSPATVDVFHAFRQDDYVHVLPMTPAGLFVLVRQYRPVIESWTLEFPGGLRDGGEGAEVTAARELREEIGFATTEIVPLIECHADVGRLCNKFFGFFALADRVADAEAGIETVLLNGPDLRAAAAGGHLASRGHPPACAGSLPSVRASGGTVDDLRRGYVCSAIDLRPSFHGWASGLPSWDRR
jgi:8-oxo-dGTP pyrophosphatase MutT (NUDIX family)